MRVYLTGAFAVESGDILLTEDALPGRQALLAATYLALRRSGPVPRHDLASAVWDDTSAVAWETALNAIVSKLRALFRPLDVSFEGMMGRYHLTLPADTWVDIEACRNVLDDAEGALRTKDFGRAWGHANVAVGIARRGFMHGFEAPWIVDQRAELEQRLVRGLGCLAEASLQNGEPSLAIQHAVEAVLVAPFREVGYQLLMRMHYAAGDRSEALHVYEECRKRLAEELGTDPSPRTQEVYLGILMDADLPDTASHR